MIALENRVNLTLLRIKKVLAAAGSRTTRRALRLGVAPSVEHGQAFRNAVYNTVVDIGANIGQFALFMRLRYPNARIESFEPLARSRSVFTKVFDGDPMCAVHPLAIGPRASVEKMFVTEHDDSSSLLQPDEGQRDIFGTRVIEQQSVTVGPLDSVLSGAQISRPALLKLDVQGYELEALKGCESLLPMFDDVYVEASFLELYRGQTLASSVIDFLHGHGFRLKGVFNQHVDLHAGPVQADFLFSQVQTKGRA